MAKTECVLGGTSVARPVDRAVMAEWLVRFAMAFVLAGSRIMGDVAPFAVGFTAAAGSSSACVSSLLGAAAGYLMSGPVFWALKYTSIAAIVCAAAVVFRSTEVFRSGWFMPACAAFVAGCIGVVPAAASGWGPAETVKTISDAVLAGGGAYFYKIALSPWSGRFNLERGSEIVHTVSVLILISTLLISLEHLQVFGIVSVGRAAAALIVFLAAFKGGVGMGCATGLSVGLAMDAASGAPPLFCMAYGLSGLVSGIFARQGRFVFAVAFILANAAVAAVSLGNAGVPAILYEVFVASVVFMILPPPFLARLSVLLPGAMSGYGAMKAREYVKGRVEQISQAFYDLYETVRAAAGSLSNDEDVALVFDRAADAVCLNCPRTADCWHVNYQTTVDAMNNASSAMLKRGSLQESDLPEHFVRSCISLADFVSAVNGELKAVLYRRQYRKKLRENQAAAFNQYADISAILGEIAEELGMGTTFEPELEARLRRYLRGCGVQAEAAVFRDKSGRLHAEIFGGSFSSLRKDPAFLEKLTAVFNVRVCMDEERSAQDRIYLLEAEPLAASVGIACRKKSEREASGDKGAYFKTDEGVLYVILSDGMGTGSQAARYSSDAVRILERFLRAGVSPETAVRMLNDLMLLKNEDDTGCATVDLMCVDLFTGETRLFKYGAAPSYLRSGGGVRRLKGRSMAAGLGVPPHDMPDQIRVDMGPGSLAVVVSDGVTGGRDDKWLCDMISEFKDDDIKEFSAAIVDKAAETNGVEDDMTAIAVLVSERA